MLIIDRGRPDPAGFFKLNFRQSEYKQLKSFEIRTENFGYPSFFGSGYSGQQL